MESAHINSVGALGTHQVCYLGIEGGSLTQNMVSGQETLRVRCQQDGVLGSTRCRHLAMEGGWHVGAALV